MQLTKQIVMMFALHEIILSERQVFPSRPCGFIKLKINTAFDRGHMIKNDSDQTTRAGSMRMKKRVFITSFEGQERSVYICPSE